MKVYETVFLAFVSWMVGAPKLYVAVFCFVGEVRFGYCILFIVATVVLVQCIV